MSIAEAAPREAGPVAVSHTDIPAARLYNELQCAAREAVGDAVNHPSGSAITALVVSLDDLLRFEAEVLARRDEACAAELVAGHDALRAACGELVRTPRTASDLSAWALGLRHELLGHIAALSATHRRLLAS